MLNLTKKFVASMSIASLLLAGPVAMAGTKTVNGTEVRDWSAIDTDKDHSMSPEEIEKFLKEQWAKNGKK